mgnify:FL=1
MEKYLIRHCAPTLASLKPANLFRCFGNRAELAAQARALEAQLLPKGLRLCVLQGLADGALLYLYRPSQLAAYIGRPEVDAFLAEQGYPAASLEQKLAHLAARIREEGGFPHEIGIFLGYPLEDVRGFIRHKGQNCRCAGYWKVYGDAGAAQKMFDKFRKCTDLYLRLWEKGMSVGQLTVAA